MNNTFGSRPLSTRRSSVVIIGDSPGMLDALRGAMRVATTRASVLIRGEGGTGKELLARFLHERSRHSAGPFVRVGGSSVGERLVEFVNAARGGTVFVDQVTQLSATAQVELLQLFEAADTIDRIGGGSMSPVDVRFVAGTDRDVEQEIAAGRFRRDLFYRIAIIELALPPLRERGDDVRMLAEHFIGSFMSARDRDTFAISRETLALLRAHPWPGNVRQLKAALEEAASTAGGPLLHPADLPPDTRDAPLTTPHVAVHDDDLIPLDELERRHIQRVVRMVSGNVRHAATLLGIDVPALQFKLRRHRVH